MQRINEANLDQVYSLINEVIEMLVRPEYNRDHAASKRNRHVLNAVKDFLENGITAADLQTLITTFAESNDHAFDFDGTYAVNAIVEKALAIKIQRDTKGLDHQAQVEHDNDQHNALLKVVTFNINQNNTQENNLRVLGFIEESNADVVCLQEVTFNFYTMLTKHDVIKHYQFVYPDEFKYGYFISDMLLIKRSLQPALYNHVQLYSTAQNRFFCSGYLTIKGLTIAIATAHLESIFFNDQCTAVKVAQLQQICSTLEAIQQLVHADCIIFAGDCNFTGTDGNQRENENHAIASVNLMDVWKYFNVTSDDTRDPVFRNRDATWNYEKNPKQIKHKEFHRPDRIFMRPGSRVVPNSISMKESDMSDHFALEATFRINI